MIEQFIKDVDKGLGASQKSLPSKYFYDKKGDELFVKIMQLPEYYLSRAEHDIFKIKTRNIIEALQLKHNTYFEFIELGAGDGFKTKELLNLLCKKSYKFSYIPIDISQNALENLEKSLSHQLPEIDIKPAHGDYFEVLDSLKDSNHPKIILFLGSNIGNIPDELASEFIYKLGANLNFNDKLLLGVDLIKSASVILPAYNDSKGVTRDFNLNLLHRINRELGGNFKVGNFIHEPEYIENEGIAKSYLVSTTPQKVFIEKIDKTYSFKQGEKILTEISRKYNDEIIEKIIEKTDFEITNKLTDKKNYFANYILNREKNKLDK